MFRESRFSSVPSSSVGFEASPSVQSFPLFSLRALAFVSRKVSIISRLYYITMKILYMPDSENLKNMEQYVS